MIQLLKCELTANDNTIYINPIHISAVFNSTQKADFPSVCIVLEGEKKYYVKGTIDSFIGLATIIDPFTAAPKKVIKAPVVKADAQEKPSKAAATKAPVKAKTAVKKTK